MLWLWLGQLQTLLIFFKVLIQWQRSFFLCLNLVLFYKNFLLDDKSVFSTRIGSCLKSNTDWKLSHSEKSENSVQTDGLHVKLPPLWLVVFFPQGEKGHRIHFFLFAFNSLYLLKNLKKTLKSYFSVEGGNVFKTPNFRETEINWITFSI